MKVKVGHQVTVDEDGNMETNSIYQEIPVFDIIGMIVLLILGISTVSVGIWYFFF